MNVPITIATLMTERGFQSKQLYQAPVNSCRDFSYDCIYNWDRYPTPLGFPSSSLYDAFQGDEPHQLVSDCSDRMTLLMHSIQATSGTPEKTSWMQSMTRCEFLSCNHDGCHHANFLCFHEQSKIGHGYLKNRMVDKLNNKSFHRLCDFFGLMWVDETNNKSKAEPTPQDIAAFFCQFSQHNLSTNKGLIAFLNAFNLQSRYVCDQSKSILENLWNFGWLLRSFTNVRISIPEGQKRWMCFCNFSQGILNFDQKIPLQFSVLPNANPAVYPHAFAAEQQHLSQNMSKWQVWKALEDGVEVMTLSPTPTMDTSTVCKTMQSKFKKVISAQNATSQQLPNATVDPLAISDN